MVKTREKNKKEDVNQEIEGSGSEEEEEEEGEEEDSITCEECGEIFAKTNNYHRHLRNIHMDIVIDYFKCTLPHRNTKDCMQKYSRNFRKHLRVVHRITCDETIDEMVRDAPRVPILHRAAVDHTSKRRGHLKIKQNKIKKAVTSGNDANSGKCIVCKACSISIYFTIPSAYITVQIYILYICFCVQL